MIANNSMDVLKEILKYDKLTPAQQITLKICIDMGISHYKELQEYSKELLTAFDENAYVYSNHEGWARSFIVHDYWDDNYGHVQDEDYEPITDADIKKFLGQYRTIIQDIVSYKDVMLKAITKYSNLVKKVNISENMFNVDALRISCMNHYIQSLVKEDVAKLPKDVYDYLLDFDSTKLIDIFRSLIDITFITLDRSVTIQMPIEEFPSMDDIEAYAKDLIKVSVTPAYVNFNKNFEAIMTVIDPDVNKAVDYIKYLLSALSHSYNYGFPLLIAMLYYIDREVYIISKIKDMITFDWYAWSQNGVSTFKYTNNKNFLNYEATIDPNLMGRIYANMYYYLDLAYINYKATHENIYNRSLTVAYNDSKDICCVMDNDINADLDDEPANILYVKSLPYIVNYDKHASVRDHISAYYSNKEYAIKLTTSVANSHYNITQIGDNMFETTNHNKNGYIDILAAELGLISFGTSKCRSDIIELVVPYFNELVGDEYTYDVERPTLYAFYYNGPNDFKFVRCNTDNHLKTVKELIKDPSLYYAVSYPYIDDYGMEHINKSIKTLYDFMHSTDTVINDAMIALVSLIFMLSMMDIPYVEEVDDTDDNEQHDDIDDIDRYYDMICDDDYYDIAYKERDDKYYPYGIPTNNYYDGCFAIIDHDNLSKFKDYMCRRNAALKAKFNID